MSNIKLKDHNWAAEGIYDTNQSKSQQTINSEVSTKVGQATLQTTSQNLSGATNELKGRADTLDSKYDNVVTVSNTQPTSQYNKVWLPVTVGEGTSVPTWAEHQALQTQVTTLDTTTSNIDILKLPTQTLTSTDLNTVRTDGVYIVGSGCANSPPQNAGGKLIVMHSGNNDYTRQIFICGYAFEIYTRARRWNGSAWEWTGWGEIGSIVSKVFSATDTIVFGSGSILTCFAGNTEKSYINIPLSKKLPASLTITHNLTIGWIRNSALDARGTVTAVTRATDNILNIEITANSGYSFTKWELAAAAVIGTITFS